MSKTDKTRPWNVQALEDLVEVHDHSNGECNLPTREEWLKTKTVRRWHRHDCTYEPRNWNTLKAFSRYGGDKDYMADKTKHKYPDWKSA